MRRFLARAADGALDADLARPLGQVEEDRATGPSSLIGQHDDDRAQTLMAMVLMTDRPPTTRLMAATNVADLNARGPLRLVAPLLAGRIREAVAANLETLRQLLESSA